VIRALVVKTTAGADDPERCSAALTVAATAAASGLTVSLWLSGEAAWLAVPERAAVFALPYSQPVPDMLAAVLENGSISVCSQCAKRRGLEGGHLMARARIAGAATYVAEVSERDVRALVY
jgi:predicted peroxiredoxin